ncbi:MAG: fatty acid desaturase family protein [Bdellovibrio sp.]
MNKKEYFALKAGLDLNKRWLPLLNFFFVEISLVGFVFWFLHENLYFLASPLIAIMMFRNFSLMHDGTHNAISNNKRINDLIGYWCGIVCLLPFRAWKTIHLHHHLWSGNIEKDPVMKLRTTLPEAKPYIQSLLTFAWRNWIPTLATLQYLLFWKLAFNYASEKNKFFSWLGVILPVTLWSALISFCSIKIILFSILPAVFLYLLSVEIINFPHHLHLKMFKDETKLPVWKQNISARTCVYPKWIARHLVLNFNFHTEHHMFPDAPWYTLEKIHEKLIQCLGSELNVDIMFSWTKKNRSLSLVEVVVAPEIESEKKAS